MKVRSLNRFLWFREILVRFRRYRLRSIGVRIDDTATISLSSRILVEGGASVTIGEETLVAFKTLIFTHHAETNTCRPVSIGARCFIGGASTICPGVVIGDGSIVGAGAVVMSDVPSGVIVAGNPARVIKYGITVGRYGRLVGADENSKRMWTVDPTVQ